MVLISDETRKDTQALLEMLIKERIERLFLPYVALQQLAQTSEASDLVPNSLREVITAGEQLQITPAIAGLFEKLENCVLHNDYGPSESHVVTAYTLTGPVSNWPLLPPIGRAISNTQIYILDKHLQVTPIGVPGELHIAGVSLARGYHYQPELTAEKFIPNPFSDDSEARLYKTGDLARYLPDGNIEFLGRIDSQVKIRGFRVEPGEIETVLGKNPAVHQTVVIAREDQPGSKRLVAYIVPDKDYSLTVSELFQFLREKLPDYMIPSTFMLLDALPLTPSGKIDRRSLPEPGMVRPELAQKYVPPRTPIEQQVADIWAEVLGLERIGIYDNFFELGGHSLMATQVISRLRKAFQSGILLRVLFEIPTVAGLAEFIEVFCSATETSDSESKDTEEFQEDIL
jgi:acyl-coenzyme A synthetase/AMP-(fatty) acid ligase/acyl carrier protein